MRSYQILIILIVALSLPLFGTCQESRIDSLRQLVAEQTTLDEEHVRLLNDYARACFHDVHFHQGLIAMRDARLLSEEINFLGGQVMYYLTLSSFLGSGQMASYCQKQAEWLSKENDGQQESYYEELNSSNHELGDDYEKLIAEFTQMFRYFGELDDLEIQANILGFIEFFQFEQGKYEESLRSQKMAIELFTDLGQIFPVFYETSITIYNLEKLGRQDEIRKVEAELIEFVSQNEDENAYGMITATMANSYAANGRHAIAIEYYLKSVGIFEQNQDYNTLISIYHNLCNAYNNLELYDKSAVVYEKLIAIADEKNNKSLLHDTYSRAAMSNYFIKKYDKARDYMTRALQETNEETRRFYLGRQNSLAGNILKDERRYLAAIPHNQETLATYLDLERLNGAPFMSMYIAECYQQLGDFPRALEYARHGLAIEEKRPLVGRRLNVNSA